MKTIILIALIATAFGKPVEEKIETITYEEQHQKQIKSAPVTNVHGSERVETYRADMSNIGQPVVESGYPQPNVNVEHVNETEYRVNIQELEEKFNTAQGQGSEGLNSFLQMIQSERESLQRAYDQMAVQAEANVRGSLQKSKEWEEKAKHQAQIALQRLMDLQRKAELRTKELLTRQSAAVECAECEERRIETIQSQGSTEFVSGASSGASGHQTGYQSGYQAGQGPVYVAGSHHSIDQQANVETTTVVQEWSTVFEDRSSTIINH